MNRLHYAGSQWDLAPGVDVEELLQRLAQLAVVLAYPGGVIEPVVDVRLADGRTLRIVVGTGVAVIVDA